MINPFCSPRFCIAFNRPLYSLSKFSSFIVRHTCTASFKTFFSIVMETRILFQKSSSLRIYNQSNFVLSYHIRKFKIIYLSLQRQEIFQYDERILLIKLIFQSHNQISSIGQKFLSIGKSWSKASTGKPPVPSVKHYVCIKKKPLIKHMNTSKVRDMTEANLSWPAERVKHLPH